MILSKMIYQLRFVQADLFQHNCTDQVNINVLINWGKSFLNTNRSWTYREEKKNRFETFVIPRQPGIVKSFKLQSRSECWDNLSFMNEDCKSTPLPHSLDSFGF